MESVNMCVDICDHQTGNCERIHSSIEEKMNFSSEQVRVCLGLSLCVGTETCASGHCVMPEYSLM